MTSSTKLSEDLVYYIALEFEYDLKTLCALSLVCRVFYRATRALVFRHIGRLSTEKEDLLETSLAETPDLVSYIHSYYVRFDDGKLNQTRLKSLLASPSIRELTFSRYDAPKRTEDFIRDLGTRAARLAHGRSDEQDFECRFLDDCCFERVHTVRLQHDFTTTELVRFMLLEGVNVLSATDLSIMKELRLPNAFASKKSMLTSLDILGGSLWRMEPTTLSSILSCCSTLRSLRCQVPMDTHSTSSAQQSSRVNTPVSPRDLTKVFKLVHATLKKLSLLNLRHRVPYDGSHLDLSEFASLTDLEITSCCLLPPGAPCDERNSLYKLLPASLQRLNVSVTRPVLSYKP